MIAFLSLSLSLNIKPTLSHTLQLHMVCFLTAVARIKAIRFSLPLLRFFNSSFICLCSSLITTTVTPFTSFSDPRQFLCCVKVHSYINLFSPFNPTKPTFTPTLISHLPRCLTSTQRYLLKPYANMRPQLNHGNQDHWKYIKDSWHKTQTLHLHFYYLYCLYSLI